MLIILKKKKTIQNSAFANEKLSSSSSITSENALTISRNDLLINCTDFNANGNTTKNSAESLDYTGRPLSHEINLPILLKPSNTELQALKNYIHKI